MSDARVPTSQAGPLTQEQIIEKVRARFGDAVIGEGKHASQSHLVVAREKILDVLRFLKEEPELSFDFLSDVTVVDHLYLEVPDVPERFAVVYNLTSVSRGHRFRVKTPASEDDPTVPSVCGIWKAALWGEREAHDMYGVKFEGNPDLRRLLMPADYDGFPLRKDYPLRGHGERDSFPKVRAGRLEEVEDGTS